MFKPDRYLKTAFNRFNREGWDGKLPSDTLVGYCTDQDTFKNELWGLTVGVEVEHAGHTQFTIFINELLKPSDQIKFRYQVLVHEMCHVARWPHMKHDKHFLEEQHRVFNRGLLDGLW